jgi:hypothetical protein
MAYRDLTPREVSVLAGLSRSLLPDYVRQLARSGVRHRDIAAVLNLSESSISDIAAAGRPPVAGQVVPEWFAVRLRQLRAERSDRLNATLAAAHDRGWTYAAPGSVTAAIARRAQSSSETESGPTTGSTRVSAAPGNDKEMTVAETTRRPGRPATGKTPTRSMRLGDNYDRAKAKAEANGETITAVVERLLGEYAGAE